MQSLLMVMSYLVYSFSKDTLSDVHMMVIMHCNKILGGKMLHVQGHKRVTVRNLWTLKIFIYMYGCMEIDPFHMSYQVYSTLEHIFMLPRKGKWNVLGSKYNKKSRKYMKLKTAPCDHTLYGVITFGLFSCLMHLQCTYWGKCLIILQVKDQYTNLNDLL